MTDVRPSAPIDACTGCAIGTRRDFLLDAMRAGAMALAAIGLAPGVMEADPLRWITALGRRGQEVSYPIPSGQGVQIDKDNEVILARSGMSVYAFALACPHQNTALRWNAAENRFQCPKHKSRYRPDGTFIEGRATRGMDRYAVKIVGAAIVVDVDRVYEEDKDALAWQHAVASL